MSWRATRVSSRSATSASRVAVIDLGSNSWRLVVYTYSPDQPGQWWRRTDEIYESVRIGEGMAVTGALTEQAMTRGLETLGIFARFCRAVGLLPQEIHTFATSAIREATNRQEFLRRVRKATGYEVEVLSGQQEAHYGYVAIVNTSTLTDGVALDIGGGSVQTVRVAGRQEMQSASLPIGALRMTEAFFATEDRGRPARQPDLQRLADHVASQLRTVPWLAGHGGRLVATGGAARNLAAAVQRSGAPLSDTTDIGVNGFTVSALELAQMTTRLASLSADQRRAVPGIKPDRGDTILAAALTLQAVLETGGFGGMEVTEAGLRDGIFLERAILSAQQPLFANVREAAVRNLAVQYESDLPHTEHVAELALQMHDSLTEAELVAPLPGERELLWAAAMLHDVGMTINYGDHHKHSHYLIVSAELPGYDPRERALIAQIARYHRKGVPKLGEWARLALPGDEELLARCAMLLRLAEHLERGHDQTVSHARLKTNGDGLSLHLIADGDLTLQRWSVERYGDGEAFERIFKRRMVIG
ncbi:MAG: HD domain-containing protein [Solirubrobacteraceae bacterium]